MASTSRVWMKSGGTAGTPGGNRENTPHPAATTGTKRGAIPPDHLAEVSRGRSVCLAARVSGGLKSRSARDHGPISKGGGNASPARERGRYGEPYTGTKAKAGHRQGGPEATSCRTPEGRAPTARWGLKGLRRTTGSYIEGSASRRMNRSAKDGEWSSLHYGGEGAMVPPHRTTVCADDTVGKRRG